MGTSIEEIYIELILPVGVGRYLLVGGEVEVNKVRNKKVPTLPTFTIYND